jgi:hypothetical protein
MIPAASVPNGVSYGERAQEQDDCLFFTKKNSKTFAALVDEFTEGAWPLSDTAQILSVSSYSDEGRDCPECYPKVGKTAIATSPSVRTAEDSSSPPTTSSCDVTRECPSGSSTETCVDSSPVAYKDGTATDACLELGVPFPNGALVHSSIRKLTNSTYLRRMHLSMNDAAALFPETKKTMEDVFVTGTSPGHFKAGISISLHDGNGRRWPVVLECLRTAGQRHVRFNKGWAEMCRATGLSIGKCVRLARWDQGSSSSLDALVTVSVM